MAILLQRNSRLMGETIQLNNLFKYLNALKQKYFFLKQSSYSAINWIFGCLDLSEDDVILDLDCHYADLWLKNDLSLYSSIKVHLIDQNLVNVRLTQEKCSNKSFNYEVRLMDYQNLQYSANQFDKVIAKIGFSVMTYDEQLAMINETWRVLKKQKNGYYVINENQITRSLDSILNEFDSSIKSFNQFKDNHTALKKHIDSLFQEVECTSYHSELTISTAAQLMDMYLSVKHPTFVDKIVKAHRSKEFDKFLAQKIQSDGFISLDVKFMLLIGKNKI